MFQSLLSAACQSRPIPTHINMRGPAVFRCHARWCVRSLGDLFPSNWLCVKEHLAKVRRPTPGVPLTTEQNRLIPGYRKLVTGLRAPTLVALSRLPC